MSDQSFLALAEQYRSNGWCRFALPRPQVVFSVRDMLERRLRELLGQPEVTLATYHQFAPPEQHDELQWALVNSFWDGDCSVAICRDNLALLREFVGTDLHVQNRPYLRLVRPARHEDNIGFHRDTAYGQSLYEVTLHIPFTALDAHGSLQFASGSHVRSEAHYGIVPTGAAPWPKGSKKHLMGFPYAPKKITADISGELVPVPLALGQAVLFPPSTIHGQEINGMETTRVSVDLRLVNSFAPITIRRELGSRGYVPLCESPVAEVANRYQAANA
jgi:hypothetical protein